MARPIKSANRIKFGSRFFWAIEHERVHTIFIQNSPGSLVDKQERTAYYRCNQINVTQALIDVDINHYLDHHLVPGKFLQAQLIISHSPKHDKVRVNEPDWNWRLTVVQSECKAKFTIVSYAF